MAYNARRVNKLDLRPSTGVGVAIPFNSPSAFKTVYTTKEQIKYNLINFLLTGRRERIFNPIFGADIRSKLFESLTDELSASVQSSIQTGIEAYFPSVRVENLEVIPNPDKNALMIRLSYRLVANNEEDELIISIQNV